MATPNTVMTTDTQTVDLSDLKIIQDADVAITVVSRVKVGDAVRFWDEDKQAWDLGVYLDSRKHITKGRETSHLSFAGDTRTMIYIATRIGGCTYADVTTISKVVSSIPTAVL